MSELIQFFRDIKDKSDQWVHRKVALEYLQQLARDGHPDFQAKGYWGRQARYVYSKNMRYLWETVPPGVYSISLPNEITLKRSKDPSDECNALWTLEDVTAYYSKFK